MDDVNHGMECCMFVLCGVIRSKELININLVNLYHTASASEEIL